MLVGIVDWLVRRRSRRGSSWHAALTIVALLLGLLNAFIHSRDGWTAVVPEGIILSGVTTLLLIVAAFLGAADVAEGRMSALPRPVSAIGLAA